MEKGFSLIELLLAVVILGFIAMLIANLPNAVNIITFDKQSSTAKNIASQILEDARAQGYDNLANSSTKISSDPRLSSLNQGSAERDINDCPSTICKNGEEVKEVTATVSWQNSTGPESVTVVTFISSGGRK